MIITDEAALKAIKTYLPYVCIVALSWINYQQFQINQTLNDARFKEQKELNTLWREAFFSTLDVAKNTRQQSNEGSHQDSSMHPFRAASR